MIDWSYPTAITVAQNGDGYVDSKVKTDKILEAVRACLK